MTGLIKNSRLVYDAYTYSVKINYKVNVKDINDNRAINIYGHN